MNARALMLSLLVLGLLASPAVLAQSGTTAVLTGRVVDKAGEPMPGVTVTAVSAKSAMAPAGTVTDANGRYRLTPLTPADDYILSAELPGFAKVEVSPIDLDPGKTTTQNITLVPSTDTMEKVTIVAKGDIVDVASTKTATVFNSEFIEGLPIIGRSYQDILTLAPGVTDVDGDGNPNVNGARSTDFQTRVDGVNTTDPVSGTFGQNLNLESIAEIEVITTGASAEFSQAQGGFANIITKSGGNDFEGSFKFFFRSDLLDNDGANNSDIFPQNNFGNVDGFQDLRPFLTLGGPIVKDKLWYFTALQYIDTETPINTLDGTVKLTQQGWNNFGKITYQPSSSQRLSLSLNWDPRDFGGLGLGTGVDPESDFDFQQGGTNITLGWTYNISPALLLEMRLARLDTGIKVTPVTKAAANPDCINDGAQCNPFTEDLYTIDLLSNRVVGPFFYQSDDSRTRNTLRADLSIFIEGFGGTHSLKTGFEFAQEGYENTITQDPIRLNFIGQAVGPGGVASGSIQFQEAFPSAFGGTGCIPTGSGATVTCRDFDTLKSEKDVLGLYIQDSFKPRPNLSINLGFRLDREDATTDGFTPFNPQEEAAEFLDLLLAGAGTTIEEKIQDKVNQGLPAPSFGEIYAETLKQPLIQFDLNGDHRDANHCGTDFGALNIRTNDLVTGFGVNSDGTYFLVGDLSQDLWDADGADGADGIADFFQPRSGDPAEDFFIFQDVAGVNECQGGSNSGMPCDPALNGSDCPFSFCGGTDGTTRLDPSLAGQIITASGNYADPLDCNSFGECDGVFFFPDGNPSPDTNGDGQVLSPNCDRISEDTAFLFQVFSRHQLDLVDGPVDFPSPISGYDNNCDNPLGDAGLPLPGTCRSAEQFNITNNNLAPRLSVSWDPWANNKTKLFATWSRFYDKLFLATLIPELGPDVRVTVYGADQREKGVNAQPSQTGRFITTQVDRNLQTPFSDEFTIGFERELAPEWSLALTYIDRVGRNQLQDIDLNHFTQDANNDGVLDDNFGRVGVAAATEEGPGGINRAPDGQPDLFVWNALFNQVLRVGNFNSSEYRSVQLVLTRRLSRQWQMTGSYVWSEAKGQAESFQSALGNDPGTSDDEEGFLSFDQTHVLKFNAVTFLPGDQSIGSTIQWSSGLPYSLILRRSSGDNFDSVFLRTTFPSGQRNDRRNEGRWNIDIFYRKNFTFGKYHSSLGVTVQDLLNSDDLIILSSDADPDFVLGLNARRDFGRRWELAWEFHF